MKGTVSYYAKTCFRTGEYSATNSLLCRRVSYMHGIVFTCKQELKVCSINFINFTVGQIKRNVLPFPHLSSSTTSADPSFLSIHFILRTWIRRSSSTKFKPLETSCKGYRIRSIWVDRLHQPASRSSFNSDASPYHARCGAGAWNIIFM